MCYSYKIQGQNQNPGPSEPKCRCSPPRQLAWALAASHAGAVRCSKGHVKGPSPAGLTAPTEGVESPWGLGKGPSQGTGRFGKPRRRQEGSFREKSGKEESKEDHTGREEEMRGKGGGGSADHAHIPIRMGPEAVGLGDLWRFVTGSSDVVGSRDFSETCVENHPT